MKQYKAFKAPYNFYKGRGFKLFIQWATANICDHSLWNLSAVKKHNFQYWKLITDTDFQYSFGSSRSTAQIFW